MIQKNNPNMFTYLYANNLYGYAMSRFLPTSEWKWTDPKEFDLNKYNGNNSKGCVLDGDFEYLKELKILKYFYWSR